MQDAVDGIGTAYRATITNKVSKNASSQRCPTYFSPINFEDSFMGGTRDDVGTAYRATIT
jgi:hypothetical protein